jgi:hypothetical protein
MKITSNTLISLESDDRISMHAAFSSILNESTFSLNIKDHSFDLNEDAAKELLEVLSKLLNHTKHINPNVTIF